MSKNLSSCLQKTTIGRFILTNGNSLPLKTKPSARSRYIRLKIHPWHGLIVSCPQGIPQVTIKEFLEANRQWIEKKYKDFEGMSDASLNEDLPDQIILRATGESIKVRYEQTPGNSIIRFLKPEEISLSGRVDNPILCHEALRLWLKGKAKKILIPWLDKISQETNLHFKCVTIRNQKSKWGSCSSDGSISLNAKLLFFTPELVRHVMVHELCHVREPNHSVRFWALVEEFEPEYKTSKLRIREAAHWIPSWAYS